MNWLINDKSESFASESVTSAEAVANVASLYNDNELTISNLKVTGKLTVDGDSELNKTKIKKLGVTDPLHLGSWTGYATKNDVDNNPFGFNDNY